MAVNKNKITTLAQKYTAKGQFEKAIGEYRKLVKGDPNDIRTWLKMGDLYTRMGARKEATETYLKVAEHYRKSDFHLKAVAVYKQVLKLDPTLIEVYEMLGDAYMSLGLTSDALIQFEQLADMYQRGDRSENMLGVLARMAQIDPQNISTRLRIAEHYSKEGKNDAAVEHFTAACEQLKEQGRTDDYLKVAERLLYHDQSLMDVAREIAALYLEKGQTKRALAKLQLCFSKEPRNVATLELLAKAFTGLSQPDKAVSVYLEIANILEEQGDENERARILRTVLAIDPKNPTARKAMGQATEAPAVEPTMEDDGLPSPALAASGNIPGSVQQSAEGATQLDELSDQAAATRAEKLLSEAEVLLKYGLVERASEHIAKIFEFDYYNLDARERMKDIFLDAGNEEGALEQLFVLADGFKEEQPEGAVYFLHQILGIDPRNRRARDVIVEIGGIMPEGLPDLVEDQIVEPEVFLGDATPDDLPADTGDQAKTQAVDQTVDSFEVELPSIEDVPYVAPDNEFSELDLDGDEWDDEVLDLDAGDELTEAQDLDAELYEVVEDPEPVLEVAKPAPTAPLRPPVRSERPQAKAPPPSMAPPPPPVLDDEEPDISEELEEIEFFLSQGLKDEARGIVEGLLVSFPDDRRVQDLEKRVLGRQEDEAPLSSLDLDALAEDLNIEDITHDEIISEIDEVFSQFKAGVEKQVSQTDFATHYDLGVAYKEMGLFDDAISEFKIALADPTRVATSQMMIGMCQAQAGRPEEAITTFTEGLEIPGVAEEGKLALMYELGKVFEVSNRVDEAIAIYNRILAEDPGFADVVDRIDNLEEGGPVGGGGQSVFS